MAKNFTIIVLALAALATVGHCQLGGLGNVAKPVTNTAGRVAAPVTKSFAEISKNLDASKAIISQALGIDPDTKLSSLFPGISGFNAQQIATCYNSTVGKSESFNMFDNPIFGVIQTYYKNFPENFDLPKLPDKVKNMFGSMNFVATYTMACLGVPTNYQLGLTQFSDWTEAAFKRLSGARDSPAAIKSKFANKPKPKDEDAAPAGDAAKPKPKANTRLFRRKRADEPPIEPKCIPKDKGALPDEFDWRSQGKVTPVKFQDDCGSCWTFASLSSLESAYLIKGKTTDKKFDLSEMQLLSCGVEKACQSGGTAVDAYNYIMANGVTGESVLPYEYKKATCDKSKKKKKSAKIKDYCLRGIYVSVDGKPEKLTDPEMQYVIREFGPVYTTIDGEHSEQLRHYKSGVFNDPKCKTETNHAVNIVGWTKDAWIVKNSWGDKWGQNGFFLLKRGSNLCGINTYISYPIV